MLPVLQYAQLPHTNNSLKFNGRHTGFLKLYLSPDYLLMSGCTHVRQQG